MKTRIISMLILAGGLGLLGYTAKSVYAQTPPAPAASVQTTPDPNASPQLSYGAQEVLKLAQAKVSQDTMVSFVQNSRLNYDLDALSIVYLRQQGVPDPVVTTMLQKSRETADAAQATAAAQTAQAANAAAMAAPATPAPVPQPDAYAADYAAPTAYDDESPAYVYDNYYPYYPYYPYYYGYPLGFSFGIGGFDRFHGGFHDFHGSGFRGGFHGSAAGFRGNAGFRGGGRGGFRR